jgi:uncharacterized membrane protein (DUF2068 family)
MSRPDLRRDRGLLVIAMLKFAHVGVLLVLMFGAVKLFHKDVAENVTRWLQTIRIDPDNRYIAAGLEKLDLTHTRELKELSALSGFYALLFAVEGTGLLFGKRWAEWLTVIATGLFIRSRFPKFYEDRIWRK